MIAVLRLVRFQCQRVIRVRDLRRGPIRAEKHVGRHVALPKGHGFAKHKHFQALDLAQVPGRGQSVRATTDDRHIAPCHCHFTSKVVRKNSR